MSATNRQKPQTTISCVCFTKSPQELVLYPIIATVFLLLCDRLNAFVSLASAGRAEVLRVRSAFPYESRRMGATHTAVNRFPFYQ